MSTLSSINPGGEMRVLTVLCTGMFMAILDVNAVNIATASLLTEFRASLPAITWAIDAYNLTLSGLMLAAGALADRYGARRIWMMGLALFVVASLGCGLSRSISQLIALRMVQGTGAALFIPASFSLMTSLWPDSIARQRAIGLFGGMVALAAAAGPVLGGLLIGAVGWRSLFMMNIPVGIYGLWAARRLLPASSGCRARRLDFPGLALSFITLGIISYVLIQLPVQRDGESGFCAMALAGLLCLAGLIVVEKRRADPMLPLRLFRSVAFNLANLTGFSINVCYFGALYVLSLILQQRLNYSPLQTGLALLPLAVCLLAGNVLAGRLMPRWGVRRQMIIGLALSACGYLAMLALTRQPALTLPAMVALAGGTAFVVPPMTATVLRSAGANLAGTASAVHTALRQTGSLLGIALAGMTLSLSASPLTLFMAASALIHVLLAVGIGFGLPRTVFH